MNQLKTMTAEDLLGLADDELKEMANRFGEKCQAAAKKTVEDAISAGMALSAMKSRVKHGEWQAWLGTNWDYSQKTAATYVTLAANLKRFSFDQPKSIRDAMAVIAREEAAEESEPAPEVVPRSERKSGQVKVSKSEEPADQPGQPSVQLDPDPNPAPKTNTKHSPAAAKAKEADKPKPAPITPEIVEEPAEADPVSEWLRTHSLSDVVSQVVASLDGDTAKKKAAKELRKLADKLDPPTKFSPPDLDDVTDYMATLGDAIGKDVATEAESFFDFYQSKGWIVGKVSMKDWRASARKWLREHKGGSGNGNAARNGSRAGLTAEQVFSAESLGRGR